MNYDIKIKLTKIKGARMEIINGKECVVIPINDEIGTVCARYVNPFRVVKIMDDVVLNVEAYELKPDKQRYGTHILKPNFTKKVLEHMTEEQHKAVPIIGNMMPWGFFIKDV